MKRKLQLHRTVLLLVFLLRLSETPVFAARLAVQPVKVSASHQGQQLATRISRDGEGENGKAITALVIGLVAMILGISLAFLSVQPLVWFMIFLFGLTAALTGHYLVKNGSKGWLRLLGYLESSAGIILVVASLFYVLFRNLFK